MTGTVVKDVGSALLKQTFSVSGKGTAGNGGFQKVWSSQMSRNISDDAAGKSDAQKWNETLQQPGKSVSGEKQTDTAGKPEEMQQLKSEAAAEKSKSDSTVSEDTNLHETEAGTGEESLQAMEVLGTAAVKLMEQICEVFGVTMEELQAAMDTLGIGQTDLLNASALKGLMLELGGAQDAYALLTDSVLYDNYQTMLGKLEEVLNEVAAELGTDLEALSGMLKDSGMQAAGTVQERSDSELLNHRQEGSAEDMAVTVEGNGELYSDMEKAAREEQTAAGQNGGTQEHNEKSTADRGPGREQPNFFVQDFRDALFRPELQQVQEAAGENPWSSSSREIMDQILDYMKLNLHTDSTSLEMQLHPASLGTLQVQIASKGGIVTANFITQNEAVKVALESQMLQLREQFEEQGVKVEAIEVTVQTHEFEQNLEQGRGRSQQESGNRRRTRRFGAGSILAADVSEAQENLADDMMAAGGSTVSFTA